MNKAYASISMDATPPKQISKYVNETCREDRLFNWHCTENIMIIHTVALYFKYFSETQY